MVRPSRENATGKNVKKIGVRKKGESKKEGLVDRKWEGWG